MKLYLRILSYLKRHWVTLTGAMVAIVGFATLDAFSLALLIPFLQTLFTNTGTATAGAGAAAGGAAGTGGHSLLDVLVDHTLGRFVDLGADPQQVIRGIIVFILVIFFIKNVFDFIRAYLVARVEQGVTRELREEVYDHLLDLDLSFFGRTRTGQIISSVTYDVELLRSLVTRQLTQLISSFFEFAAALVLMVAISARLTLAAFIVIPATMAIWGPMLKRLRKGDRRVLDLAGEVNSQVQETLTGIRLVKSSAAEAHERERFGELARRYYDAFLSTETLRALGAPITEMLAALGTVILLWYGAHLVLGGGVLSGEEFLGFLALSMRLYAPVKFISKFPAMVQPGVVGAERVFEFLDAPVEIRNRPDARPFPGIEEAIVYDDVSFSYRPGEPVLTDVSFRVPRGAVYALVGPSGSGKTTLVDLLGRFYEVTSGRILIDGSDIREFDVKSLRASLGIVSQETVLFHDTVRANIAYGLDGEVSDEAVERAARAAYAHEFITRLHHGYDTVVGERGTELSGGQRQRIAIARAILRDPPILVFDEATSALDTESEQVVQRAVERLLQGRTVIVIAHRLSTVRKADRILVVQGGRIVERGDHASLYRDGGLYRHLYDLQFQDADVDENVDTDPEASDEEALPAEEPVDVGSAAGEESP